MNRFTPRAVTLIETLGAVALIAMAAAALAPMLATSSDAARHRSALAGMLDLDQRARLTARRLGPCTLSLEEDRAEIRLRDSGERVAGLELPRGVGVWLVSAPGHAPVEHLNYDRTGATTTSYRLVVGEGERRTILTVSGATGWAQEVVP